MNSDLLHVGYNALPIYQQLNQAKSDRRLPLMLMDGQYSGSLRSGRLEVSPKVRDQSFMLLEGGKN